MNTHAHLVNAHHMDGTMARSGGRWESEMSGVIVRSRRSSDASGCTYGDCLSLLPWMESLSQIRGHFVSQI